MMMLVSQLASYGLFLVAFAGIAYCMARRWGMGGMFAGHFMIATIITFLDLRWVHQAMAVEGWDGTPDLDIVFEIGVLIRIVLTNALLLPVMFVALLIRKARRLRMKEASAENSIA